MPNDFKNGLQVVAENIDSWRTIADLQTSSIATSYAWDLNSRTNSTISTRLDQLGNNAIS